MWPFDSEKCHLVLSGADPLVVNPPQLHSRRQLYARALRCRPDTEARALAGLAGNG
jgi:hypothetical protein